VPEFVHQRDVPGLLKQHLGIQISLSSVHRKFSPLVGEGPPPAGYWSGRPYYRPADVLQWARDRMTPTRITA
jgi:hypothetical protein